MGDVSGSSVQWLCQGIMDYPHDLVYHKEVGVFTSSFPYGARLSVDSCSRAQGLRQNGTIIGTNGAPCGINGRPTVCPAAQSSRCRPRQLLIRSLFEATRRRRCWMEGKRKEAEQKWPPVPSKWLLHKRRGRITHAPTLKRQNKGGFR